MSVTKKTCGIQIVALPDLGGKANSLRLNQDGVVLFQIFLNGFYAFARIGNAGCVGLAQFVMYEQFADHCHLKVCVRHTPELTGFQRLLGNAARQLDFDHG
jgi:hypothetical protein